MTEEYRFYGHNPNKIGWMFSNFSNHPININGRTYPTSEHYFQSMKFVTTDPDWADKIAKSPNPTICKKMGGSRDHPLRKDWEEIKDDVMRLALKTKAEQHPIFLKELLSTRGRTIIEASPHDYYWGEGKNRTGKNMLGILLMELRDSIAFK